MSIFECHVETKHSIILLTRFNKQFWKYEFKISRYFGELCRTSFTGLFCLFATICQYSFCLYIIFNITGKFKIHSFQNWWLDPVKKVFGNIQSSIFNTQQLIPKLWTWTSLFSLNLQYFLMSKCGCKNHFNRPYLKCRSG